MVGKIIITGNSIEEIEEQLATIKGLAVAGCKCGCGGSSITECEMAVAIAEMVCDGVIEIEEEEVEVSLEDYSTQDLIDHLLGKRDEVLAELWSNEEIYEEIANRL